MPSEHRLHPLSVLFGLVAQVRNFLLPGVFVLFAGSQGWWGDWQRWAMVLVIPYAFVAILRYVTFRYRYEAHEMVIRTGLLFRNERHVPYARIQNLDAVQNVFHRLLGVVEVRVETGGGQEPEAKMSVLPVAAYEEMRRRVFAGRTGVEAPADAEAPPSAAPDRTLLRLPLIELLLCGFIENRGVVLIATGFGLIWELGLGNTLMERIFGGEISGRFMIRDLFRSLLGQTGFPLGRIALTFAAFAGLLLFIRLISMVWALTRLYGFRITRAGEDLRTEYGLFTRVVATIPLRRIQTLTIREGPFHQLFRRASVKVQTAGGGGEGGEEKADAKQREWLAPIIRRDELPAFLHEVAPEVDLATIAWRPVEPRAFRRVLKQSVLMSIVFSLPFVVALKAWALVPLAVFLVWGYINSRIYVRNLGWAVTDSAVLFRSGWIWRQVSVARFAKIQAVAIHESPFDRRAAMARVRVDTAGAGMTAHRVDIPYLARETARDLYRLLARQAAHTAFRW